MTKTSVIAIEGIGEAYGKKLVATGIKTVEDLLEQGKTVKGRQEVAEKTGISAKLILAWVNKADLLRINGIGPQYSDLLEAGGVDTVPELANRNPENLFNKLMEVNQQKKLVRKPPTQAQVEAWVEQAKNLPRVVTY